MMINNNLIYREIIRNGLKKTDMNEDRSLISNQHLFPKWTERYMSHQGINVFCNPAWEYFLQFTNGDIYEEEFIKLYIPLDKEHLYEGANILFDFIESQNITHLSKISQEVRSDNVVVRLKKNDTASAKKIIDFINNNAYLKEGLNKTNPFTPTYNGIGIMQEKGISYNNEMAFMISNYILRSYNDEKENVSINDFLDYFSKHCYNGEVQDIFGTYIGNTKSELNSSQKLNLLIESLAATYNKYGYSQAKWALEKSLDGDFSSFTNHTYRKNLKENLDPLTIRTFIYKTLERLKIDINQINIEEIIKKYCDFIFEESRTLTFEEICKTTLEKYDNTQLQTAIIVLMEYGNEKYFSRYKNDDTTTNYRLLASTYDKESITNAMKKSLILRGINPNNISLKYLTNMYVHELENGLVKNDASKKM